MTPTAANRRRSATRTAARRAGLGCLAAILGLSALGLPGGAGGVDPLGVVAARAAPLRLLKPSADAPNVIRRLQAVIDRTRLATGIPGLSVAVRFPDGTTWDGVSGLADVARGLPVTIETPFALASISKTFVAAIVMSLVEQGQLHLGDSVARLLPGVQLGKRSIDPRISVRQLLDHTSGLRDFLTTTALDRAVVAAPTEAWSVTRSLSYVGPPLAEPGVRFYYANTNFVLLGLIVERVTGHPIAVEIRDRLLDPLGLTTATYQGLEPPASTPALAYRFDSNGLTAAPIDVTDGTAVRPFTAITTAAGAAGSMMANAHDTASWLEALLTGRVVAAATVARMEADADRATATEPGYAYGLGLQAYDIAGRSSFGHSGRLIGQRTIVRYFPEAGLTVAVLTDQSRTDPVVVLRALLAVLLPSNADSAQRPS